jgi:hypothetical protein
MEEAPPFDYLPDRASRLKPLLRALLELLVRWGEERARG